MRRSASPELEAALHEGVDAATVWPRARRLRARRDRRRSAARVHLSRRPGAQRPRRHRRRGGGRHRHRRLRSGGPSPWPTCSRRSPTTTSASSRCSRCCPDRSRPTTTLVNPRTGKSERMHSLLRVVGIGRTPPRPRSSPARSPRRSSSTTSRPATRWRRAAHPSVCRSSTTATPSTAWRCHGHRQGRRRQARRRAAEAGPRGPDAPRPPRLRDPPDRAPRCRRRSRAGGSGAAAQPLRRRGRHRARARRLPRDARQGRPRPKDGTRSRAAAAVSSVSRRCSSSRSPRAKGFEFVDKVTGGAIPRNLIPAVGKGIHESMQRGGPHGFPVVDVRATVLDGKYHAVDSDEMSFKMAGALALRAAIEKVGTVVLEPVSRLADHRPDRPAGRRDGRPQQPSGPDRDHRAGNQRRRHRDRHRAHQRDDRLCRRRCAR